MVKDIVLKVRRKGWLGWKTLVVGKAVIAPWSNIFKNLPRSFVKKE